ncbi:YdcF family protein [Limnohabitans sp. 63ED37-2]|uniref:YdcF family protein n=1 Tax=Limnohabitans sp. 63ED37-2 TaxID=1678128 RepID=UPI001E590A72|nr:YdcF family protein [Limnohabitans sp. 63ED37-2]
MLWSGLVVLGLLGFEAGPHALLRHLENRYPVPTAEAVGRHVGVIVLGGATEHSDIYQAHGQVPLGQAAERMSVPVGLMRQHPNLQLVFSGGEGRLLATGVSEAELAKAFYQQQGVDMSRVVLEGGSRTTRENAIQVAALLGERCKQPWLLVTSAWHMPRSVPEFEAVGCQVTPYPVDFRTGAATAWTEYSLARSLLLWQTALHEWLGLWVYGVTR